MNYLAPNTFQEAGANHRWRGPFRCRDPRRELAVALSTSRQQYKQSTAQIYEAKTTQ